MTAIERIYGEALSLIAAKSQCACWRNPGMGSGLSPVWIGCAAHQSGDPEEWCLTCIAAEALQRANAPAHRKANP